LPEDVAADIFENNPRERLGVHVSYAHLLKALKAVGYTTYSLRYFAISFFLELCNGNKEAVARRFTLHRDTQMLDAFYGDWQKIYERQDSY
jgi:hypothetical protein